MILNLIILVAGFVVLVKMMSHLSKYFLLGLAMPFYLIYQFFLPEQKDNAKKVLKVFALPVFIMLFPFIVAYKMRLKHPQYALWSAILWSLTYLVFGIGLITT